MSPDDEHLMETFHSLPGFVPPRPLYFEPEDPRVLGACPACMKGGVCSCILNVPEIT